MNGFERGRLSTPPPPPAPVPPTAPPEPPPPIRLRTIPIVEMFGPTFQGEGPNTGAIVNFIRTGLCDYRCSWCDSLHAVLPEEVKANAEQLRPDEIVAAYAARLPDAPRVILSGGNPAMHEGLGDVVDALHARGILVDVETQGSLWRPWLAKVDTLIVSPKPPSSGMATAAHAVQLSRFLASARAAGALPVPKIVVFDEVDYDWASIAFGRWRGPRGFHGPLYLSAGTAQPPAVSNAFAAFTGVDPLADAREDVGNRLRWLAERVAADGWGDDVRIGAQLHVIAWGHLRGV